MLPVFVVRRRKAKGGVGGPSRGIIKIRQASLNLFLRETSDSASLRLVVKWRGQNSQPKLVRGAAAQSPTLLAGFHLEIVKSFAALNRDCQRLQSILLLWRNLLPSLGSVVIAQSSRETVERGRRRRNISLGSWMV